MKASLMSSQVRCLAGVWVVCCQQCLNGRAGSACCWACHAWGVSRALKRGRLPSSPSPPPPPLPSA
eukprot:5331764-Lingulodinium_polyedra.AAC.1